MRNLILTSATAILLTAAASQAVVYLEGKEGAQDSYTVLTPAGVVELRCGDASQCDVAQARK